MIVEHLTLYMIYKGICQYIIVRSQLSKRQSLFLRRRCHRWHFETAGGLKSLTILALARIEVEVVASCETKARNQLPS